ncbi:LacI family DNA-binding transcriptional regulator [Georgenia halophila]|uniref:LacI family DNA-binding transcriptional regulator n=2 Tax=Georgenia halophila TaxID=620889 RepID=A0ABP8KY01_9MICO
MADVAGLAGVSHQTVSRVLNNPDVVRPETRRRVEEAIRALGYRRNTAARALRTRQTGLIGVVNSGEARFGPAHMTMAIEEAARQSGYATTMTVVRDAKDSTVETVLEFFLEHRVDGIIVIAPVTAVAAAANQLVGQLPVVLVAAGLRPTSGLRVVGIDQELGAALATRHLLELGHRQVLHVSGPDDWFDARSRIAGWRCALESAGVEVPAPVTGGWDAADGHRVACRLIDQRRVPTAVFAANDLMALGMIRAFHEAGLRVPDDVSVVGFDDAEGTGYFSPPLTTVRQPFSDVGRAAIHAFLQAVGGEPSDAETIAPELVVRESSGPPPRV